MNINSEARKKIVAVLLSNRANFEGSDAKYAASLDINKAVYARLKTGETERVMSDVKFISIARRLGVQLGDEPSWVVAETSVYQYITGQLTLCQAESMNGIYCDIADIGKTFTAKDYARNHKSAVYVDCSLVKSKQKLIRFIAREFGINHTGKYADVFEDLVYYLKLVHKPLVILDEAGDLDYPAFLELKAMWNATEHHCGWYMMGADGLQAKIDAGIAHKKVGYTEIFSRYGAKYQRITPHASDERKAFMQDEQASIINANLPQVNGNLQTLILKTNGSLRSLYNQIIKMKRPAA